MNTDIQKNNYMPGLDGLRALAVFAVIAYHLNLPFVPGGFLGVTLFFVLSGYLITDLLLSEWQRSNKISLKGFFIRRGKRLLPSVLFLLLCIAAYISVFQPEFLTNFKSEVLPAMFFFSNWWNIFHGVPYFSTFETPSLLTHFWSLAVEVQFYLVWPVLIIFGQRFIKRKWLNFTLIAIGAAASAILMAVLYQPGFDPSRIYYGTDTRVFSLLLGACLAFAYPSINMAKFVQKKSVHIILDLAGLFALLSILFMTYYITQYDGFLYLGGMFLFSAACVVLVAAAASPATRIGKIFSNKPLQFIGKISYGVYLWQFPVIVLSNSLVQTTSVNLLLSVFQVTATILLATLSYYLIERPIRNSSIIASLRKKTFHDYCLSCLHAPWRVKTAALLVTALILITGIGLLKVQAAPDTGTDDPVASPSQAVSAEPSPSPLSSPSPEAAPAPASPSISPSDTPEASPSIVPEKIVPSDLNITIIGDSVTLDVAPYLQKYYPNMTVDAIVGRQFYQVDTVINDLLEKNQLASMVVIELGTNGSFSEAQMRAVIELLGSDRKIVFVNSQVPKPWCAAVNSTLAKVSAEYTNTVVADWYSSSVSKSDYFYKDGVHPNKTGSPVLAKVIADAIAKIQS